MKKHHNSFVYKQICMLPKKGKMIFTGDLRDEKYNALFNALKTQNLTPLREGGNMIYWDSATPKLKWNEWMSTDGMKYFTRDFDKYFVFDEKYRGHVTGQDYGI